MAPIWKVRGAGLERRMAVLRYQLFGSIQRSRPNATKFINNFDTVCKEMNKITVRGPCSGGGRGRPRVRKCGRRVRRSVCVSNINNNMVREIVDDIEMETCTLTTSSLAESDIENLHITIPSSSTPSSPTPLKRRRIQSLANAAGVIFSIPRIKSKFRNVAKSENHEVEKDACVFTAAVLDFIIGKMLKEASEAANLDGYREIQPGHLEKNIPTLNKELRLRIPRANDVLLAYGDASNIIIEED